MRYFRTSSTGEGVPPGRILPRAPRRTARSPAGWPGFAVEDSAGGLEADAEFNRDVGGAVAVLRVVVVTGVIGSVGGSDVGWSDAAVIALVQNHDVPGLNVEVLVGEFGDLPGEADSGAKPRSIVGVVVDDLVGRIWDIAIVGIVVVAGSSDREVGDLVIEADTDNGVGAKRSLRGESKGRIDGKRPDMVIAVQVGDDRAIDRKSVV